MLRTLVALALCAPAFSQGSCLTNLVPNGNFTNLLPDPWTVTGPVTAAPAAFNTNALGVSTSMSLTASSNTAFTLAQSTQITLNAQTTYHFTADVWHPSACCGGIHSVDIGLTANATRTSIGSRSLIDVRPSYLRLSFAFQVPSTGAYRLDLTFRTQVYTIYVDNVSIRVANAPVFNFPEPRISGGNNRFTIDGTPNDFVVMFLGFSGYGPFFRIPGCTNDWALTLPAFDLLVVSLGTTGSYSNLLAIPASLSGIPMHWQTASLPPNCVFGCPDTIGFP